MRSRSVRAVGLAGVLSVLSVLAVLSVPSVAGALSCGDADWRTQGLRRGGSFAVDREVPASVEPWFFAPCNWTASQCFLVADDDMVAVSAEQGACISDAARVTLTPERPLVVGEAYGLECAELPMDVAEVWPPEVEVLAGRLHVVDGDAAAPISFTLSDAHITLDDDGCCSDGGPDALELEALLVGDAAGFFAEGGRIDVTAPSGDAGSIQEVDAAWVLPPEDGAWTFVAVAADGTRGEPVTLSEREVREDPVYIPCRMASNQGLPLPLVVPFLWLGLGRRRARRSR